MTITTKTSTARTQPDLSMEFKFLDPRNYVLFIIPTSGIRKSKNSKFILMHALTTCEHKSGSQYPTRINYNCDVFTPCSNRRDTEVCKHATQQ
jgi:hypothetical protein